MINIDLESISDKPARDVLESLVKQLNAMTFLKGKWQRVEVEITGNSSGYIIPHTLKFTPQDVLVTYQTTTGSVEFKYDQFDRTKIIVAVSGAGSSDITTIKAFIGSYQEG